MQACHHGAWRQTLTTLGRNSIVLLLPLMALPLQAHAEGHAHVHGVAKLDIAVETTKITLQLDSPLDNLLGFERAPRTSAERKRTEAAIAQLRAGATMFKIDQAAQCTLAAVELSSAALKLGTPDPAEAHDGHADLDGSFEFNCVDATKAAHIDVGLFGFTHLQRLEVRVVTVRDQFKRDLKRPMQRVILRK